jgi:hypothetical protein
MSNINTTIAANPANSASSANPASPAFFLIFDCANVEPSLTNPKSNTSKSTTHFFTRTVKPCHRETSLK